MPAPFALAGTYAPGQMAKAKRKLPKVLHGPASFAIDGKDGIARLEPRDRRRLTGHDVTHERHPEIELEAERAEKVSFPLAGVQRRE